jgi:hypothetical protein
VTTESAGRGPLTWRFSRALTVLNAADFRTWNLGADLARRKPGVQIPSPPPLNLQVRASPASSGRRSLHVTAALRPRAQVVVQVGRLSETRRLGPGPPTMTTERSRCLQPEVRVRCDASESGLEATLAHADGQAVRGYARTARPGPLLAGGCPPHRCTPRSYRWTQRSYRWTQRMRTRNARTPTRDAGRPRPDLAQRTRGHRGQWTVTPDADATEYADRATKAPQASGQTSWTTTTTRPPDHPLGRRTVDLLTAPAALGNDDGSASVRYLPARDHLLHYQRLLGRSVGRAAPRRTALLG